MSNDALSCCGCRLRAPLSEKGTTDYVLVQRMPALRAVTGCMWIKCSNSDTHGTPLSYAVPAEDNELILYDYKNLGLNFGDQLGWVIR